MVGPCRSAAPANCRNGSTTGTCRRPRSTTGTSRICSGCFPAMTSMCAARRRLPPPQNARSRFAVIRRPGGRPRGASIFGPDLPTATTPTHHPEISAGSRAYVPQPVRRAPAVSDRRKLRRHVRDRRDAPAGRPGRDPPVAGPSRGMAGWSSHRPASGRRIRGRSHLAAWSARTRDHPLAPQTAVAGTPRQHVAHLQDPSRCDADAGRR
jgi:hypothetical protein